MGCKQGNQVFGVLAMNQEQIDKIKSCAGSLFSVCEAGLLSVTLKYTSGLLEADSKLSTDEKEKSDAYTISQWMWQVGIDIEKEGF